MTPQIYFRCRAMAHQLSAKSGATAAQPSSPITWHEGRWAYCPSGAADGHDWTELASGLSVADLKSAVHEARA